jgi:hypothetical protein
MREALPLAVIREALRLPDTRRLPRPIKLAEAISPRMVQPSGAAPRLQLLTKVESLEAVVLPM